MKGSKGMGEAKPLWLSLIRYANKKTRNSRVLRRTAIWGYSSIVRANVFLPPPKVLLTGPPKSGTHLLSDCLSLMPKMMFSGRHFALPDFFTDAARTSDYWSHRVSTTPLDIARLKKYLERCPQGMFVTAHARFHPAFSRLVEELRFKHILLLRDPRDVAVSHAFYMLQDTLHPHHGYYTRTLKSDEERLMASIRGFGRKEGAENPLRPIGESFGAYLPWLKDPSTLVVRFEDLIGAQGGGDDEKQLGEIERIGDFVERPLNREQARQVAHKMYGKGSLTFRKGRVGDWQNHFTAEHKSAFKEVAGDLLTELGYESDSNW
jgi:hypothetical protein